SRTAVFFFYSVGPLRALLSFPTRRSSDLDTAVVVVDEEPQLGRDRLADLAHVVEPVELARERLEHLQVRDRPCVAGALLRRRTLDRKSTRLNSSHVAISYAVFCLKKKKAQ